MDIFNKPISELSKDELKELANYIANCPTYVYRKNDDGSVDLIKINNNVGD